MVQRQWRLRLFGFGVAFALGLGALELASLILFYFVDGRSFSYERIAREQAAEVEASLLPRVRSAADLLPVQAAIGGAVEGRPETTPAELVPHPFLGFVYDPESALLKSQQGRGAMELTEHGFFRIPGPVGMDDELSVAVVGGSMAAYFAVDGREALVRVLGANPTLRGKRVSIQSFALGGFKQPQMMATLAYLLALGHRFDVVVELDGFNDLALSFANHKVQGLFPFYPRDWARLVGQVPDVQDQRRIGLVAYLQERRGRLAQRFAQAPLSWSVTAALVWRRLDRRLAVELGVARQDLATAPTRRSGYRERGPLRRYANDQDLLREIARVWALSSLQMQRLCAGSGMRYYHFLQPNQYVPGSKPMQASERAAAYRADHPSRPAVEQGYPLLQAEGARLKGQGVEFHDLSQLFSGVTEPLYVDDCCHVNARGNALMAEAIGREIAAGWSR